ncbi:MAG: helix-turn-helix domain-containing protein [Candidatus Magnetobacterium sp. LHC-1]|nr:helix-turn-helix domain-containing protein [Nitrospirota bacterium]
MKAELTLPHELVEQIADSVIERLRPLIAVNERKIETGTDTIFNVKLLCDYLKVTPTWIYERTHLNEIPFIKIGGQLRFKKKAIDKWVDSFEIPAASQYKGKLRALK